MYNNYQPAEAKSIQIKDSKIENCDITHPIISGGTASGLHLNGAVLDFAKLPYSGNNLETIIEGLQNQLNWHQTQLMDVNKKINFLLKLLVQKSVLDDENELKELIDSVKIVDKLAEASDINANKSPVI